MYKIVKSNAVELANTTYTIQETYRVAAPSVKAKGALLDDAESLQYDDAYEAPAVENQLQNEGAQAAEIKQMAHQQAEAILRDAAQRAQEEYLATLRKAEVDAQVLRDEAGKQGRLEGMQAQAEHVRQCVQKVEEAVGRMEAEQAAYMVEYEQKLKWLALEVSSKILAKKIAANDNEMAELVRSAVSAAGNAKWISVEVSDKMHTLLHTLQDDIAQGKQFELHAVSAPLGTCRIETTAGVIDASIGTQIENLREYFESEQPE